MLELTQLRYTTSLLECKDVKSYDTPILYFIRPDLSRDVDATRFERDILTGQRFKAKKAFFFTKWKQKRLPPTRTAIHFMVQRVVLHA